LFTRRLIVQWCILCYIYSLNIGKGQQGIYDFHTHSCLSDGALSPIELIRRASQKGYHAIAITDHVGLGSLERLISEITRDCSLARKHWDIVAIPGVELTHLPPAAIGQAARQAKEMGARVVVVHGESIVEPVEAGTNLAAVQSPDVDILAHPGLLSLEEAQAAAANRVFIEISARKGHCLTNGHVAQVARMARAKLLLGSDAHDPEDLMTESLAVAILKGCGLQESEVNQVLAVHPRELLGKLKSAGFP